MLAWEVPGISSVGIGDSPLKVGQPWAAAAEEEPTTVRQTAAESEEEKAVDNWASTRRTGNADGNFPVMHAVIGIRRALRVGGSGMRALLLARNALHLAADLALPADALKLQESHVCPTRRFGGGTGAGATAGAPRSCLLLSRG